MIAYRNGTPSEKLARLQGVLVKMLGTLSEYCDRHGLELFLAAGTALGAERHGGLIPWDDDVDCGMFREDFERLIAIWASDPIPGMFLQTWKSDPGYQPPFAKLRLDGTLADEGFDDCGSHHGIFIDIFPYDAVPENRAVRLFQHAAIGAVDLVLMPEPRLPPDRQRGRIRRVLSSAGRMGKRWISATFLSRIRDWLYRLPWARKGDMLDCYGMFGTTAHQRTRIARSAIFPLRTVECCGGGKFKVPGDNEAYLSRLYGDYRQLPPEEARNPGHFVRVEFGGR